MIANIIYAKKYLFWLIILLISIGIFYCGDNDTGDKSGDTSNTPSIGGTFYYSLDEIIILDPHSVTDTYSASVKNQIFEGLIEFDINTQPIPALAESWIISDDRRTYTLFLRKGVQFHNGKVFKSQDVVYSLEKIISSNTSGGLAAYDFLNKIEGAAEFKEGKLLDSIAVMAAKSYAEIYGLERIQ